jgi:hypothetical protein
MEPEFYIKEVMAMAKFIPISRLSQTTDFIETPVRVLAAKNLIPIAKDDDGQTWKFIGGEEMFPPITETLLMEAGEYVRFNMTIGEALALAIRRRIARLECELKDRQTFFENTTETDDQKNHAHVEKINAALEILKGLRIDEHLTFNSYEEGF